MAARHHLVRAFASAAIAALACSAPADDGSSDSPPSSDARPAAAETPTRWVPTRSIEDRFRAFAWGAGDTLWGIARGRLAFAPGDGSLRRHDIVAWDVHATPAGTISWTDERGLHVRTEGRTRIVERPPGIGNEHTGPEVLWSPNGRRALLTWTGEGGTRHSLLEDHAHRILDAHVDGYMAGAAALWLDDDRVLLHVTAHAGRSGATEYRESGYRADIALLRVQADSIRLVTSAADGEYLVIEGLLHRDTVLIGVRREDAAPVRHYALDTRAWHLTPRLDTSGAAAASTGAIAVLRPHGAAVAEPTFQLLIIGRDSQPATVDTVSGYAVRLLWHPSRAVLAVAQESEQSGGIRTLVFEREGR